MWTHSIAICLYMDGYELIEHRGVHPSIRTYSYLYVYRVSDSIEVSVYRPRRHSEFLLVPQAHINNNTYFMSHYHATGWVSVLDTLHVIESSEEDIMDMAKELDRMEEPCG